VPGNTKRDSVRTTFVELTEVLAAIVVAIEIGSRGGDPAFALTAATRRTTLLHHRFADGRSTIESHADFV
jgi:hypothetical protein